MKWFIKDNLPFSTVEKKGLQNFLIKTGVIDSVDLLPSESHLRKTVLEDLYAYGKAKVIQFTSKIQYANIQFDMWTDNYARNAYIGILVTYIDENWIRQNIALETKEFPHPQKGIRIKDLLLSCLKDYGIPIDRCHAVTDNGKNVLSVFSFEDMNMKNTTCIGHNINLLIRADGCDRVSLIQKAFKSLSALHTGIVYRRAELIEAEANRKQIDVINKILAMGIYYNCRIYSCK